MCPKCSETIKLGCNGPANMENHIGKTKCLATQKQKAKVAKVKPQQTLLLAMFKPRPKVVPTVHAPEVVGGKIPITSTENGDLPISSESLVNTPVIIHPTALPSQPQPTLAVSRLAQHVLQLPDALPIATLGDKITDLSGDPLSILEILHNDEDDPYEWLDRQLNSVCRQWAIIQGGGIWALALKRGELSLGAPSEHVRPNG